MLLIPAATVSVKTGSVIKTETKTGTAELLNQNMATRIIETTGVAFITESGNLKKAARFSSAPIRMPKTRERHSEIAKAFTARAKVERTAV